MNTYRRIFFTVVTPLICSTLSYGAAKMLGLGEDGIGRVRLDLIQTATVASNQGLQ